MLVTGTLYCGAVSIAPVDQELQLEEANAELDVPWVCLVWNDPVNLMSYVTWVFRSYFGYPQAKAHALMLDVHHKGKAVVAVGPREQMERHTEALQGYGLWATFSKDD